MAWVGAIVKGITWLYGIYETVVGSEVFQFLYGIYEYAQSYQEAQQAKLASITYSKNCEVTQCNPQAPVPVIYGEHKVAGNIFYQGFSGDRQHQYLLVGLCRGPVEDITDVKLNDYDINSLENEGCSCIKYLGTADQRLPYNYLTDAQYGVKDLEGFDDIGGARIFVNPNIYHEKQVSKSSLNIIADNGGGFRTTLRPCRSGCINSVSVWVMSAPSGNYFRWAKLYIQGYSETGVLSVEDSKEVAFNHSEWKKITVSTYFPPEAKQIRIKVTFSHSILEFGEVLWAVDELKAYEGEQGLHVLHGCDDVGGLKNLAFLIVTVAKCDELGESIPNVTCMVKGKKVPAYGGVEGEWVSNLLTANQADVETDLTGFEEVYHSSSNEVTLTRVADLYTSLLKPGNHSLKVEVDGTYSNQGFATTSTTVAENQTYTGMVWLYQDIEGEGGKVKLYLQEYTDSGVLVGETASDEITLSNHWVRYSVSCLLGATGRKAKLKVVTDGAQSLTFRAAQLMLYKGTGVDLWMKGGENTGCSDNPAWCMLDLMRNPRYGVGYSDSQLDLESFRTVAQYCAEQIPPLPTGDQYAKAPRFRLNLVLDWQESWINVFNKLRLNFNAYAIERQGKFTLKNNIPESTAQFFDMEDIVPNSMAINWKGLDQDYDVVRVHYTDPKKKWTRQYAECRVFEFDENKPLPAKPKVLEIELFGTTDRAQASRIATYHYRRNQHCKINGEFKTSMMAANLTPGDVIEITYPPFAWNHQKVMILAIQVMENHDIRINFEIYDEQIFTDEEGTDEPDSYVSDVLENNFDIPEDPTDLALVETKQANVMGVYQSTISGSFTKPQLIYDHAQILLSTDGGITYQDAGETDGETFTINSAPIGVDCYVKVKSVSKKGLKSNGVVQLIKLEGYNSDFASVTGLTSRYEANVLTLVWNAVADSRPLVYEIRKGSSWNTAITLGTTPLTRFVTQGNGIYWVSATYNGIYSISPASIDVEGSLIPQNVIAVGDEYTTGWSGTVSDGAVKVDGGIKLAGSGMFDDIPVFDDLTSVDFYGGIQAIGTYTIPESHRIDIGVAENCNIMGSITVTKEASPDFTGVLELCAGGKIYIRIAQDDGVFGDWNEFIPGPYLGRIFDFQVRLTSSDPGATAFLSRFTYSVDMPDKYDQGKEVWVETTGTVIPFNYNFHMQPQMLITVLNAEGGETVVLKSNEITDSQFTVRIINGSGTPVRKQINWVAKGY